MLAEGGVELVQGMTIFVVAGILMAAGALVAGRFVRPNLPHPEKSVAYECGEPAIGTSWVQFDLRFYVVALLFIIFDVVSKDEPRSGTFPLFAANFLLSTPSNESEGVSIITLHDYISLLIC